MWLCFIPIPFINGILREAWYKKKIGEFWSNVVGVKFLSLSFLIYVYLFFGKYTREFQDFSSIRYSQYANYTLNELCELADLISSFDIFIKEYSSILKSDHCLIISKTFETYKYSAYSKKNKLLYSSMSDSLSIH